MSDRRSPQPPSLDGHSSPVMPPIITNEKDREFLSTLNRFIETELANTDTNSEEERYVVYKAAFDKIIDYVGAYKPLLTAIKAEYEDVIDTIQNDQREAFYLSGKVKAIASEPSTLRNYRKRADELETKMSVIRADNERLSEQIRALREARETKERQRKEVTEPPKRVVKKDKRSIPGLSLQQSTDPKTLQRELDKLDRQLKELSIAHRTRYTPKEVKAKLKEHLTNKVSIRDQLSEKTDILKYKRQKLKVAVEAAQAYMKIQPPHQTVGDAVVNALHRANTQAAFDKDEGMARGTPSTTFEEDDPAREKEAEMMLEYIEKFTELMEDKKYEDAAVHAANSPKGILRTVETMQKFQAVQSKTTAQRSALLAFCDAILATVPAYGARPNETISLEAVRCTLDENRLDLLAHWVSQNRLTLNKEIGDTIYHFVLSRLDSHIQYLSLAQHVYSNLALHKQAVKCMVIQGKVNQALQYSQFRINLSMSDFAELLKEYPSEELSYALLSHEVRDKKVFPIGVLANTLLETGNDELALKVLLKVFKKNPNDEDFDIAEIRKAVFMDSFTSQENWMTIARLFERKQYTDVSLNIVAATIVLKAVKGASQIVEKVSKYESETEILPKKGRLRFTSITDSESENESVYADSTELNH